MTMTASRAIRWGRWGVAAAMVLIAAAVAVRLYFLDGWLRTVRIDGASMAPTLCGKYVAVTCTDCGIAFRVDAEHLPESGKLVCPNCGCRELNAGGFPAHPGDTVLVDRWPLVGASPRRWTIVAYDDPLADGPAVKRVMGMPGEQMSIRGGDLYADGQIVRKSLAELRQVAVLVHDNDHLPPSLASGTGGKFLRWKPQRQPSGWSESAGALHWESATSAAENQPDWLEYVHFRGDASLTPRDQPAAILDNDPYNQAQPRRLNQVTDLLLSCEVEFPESGQLTLAVRRGESWLTATVDAASGSIRGVHGGWNLASAEPPRSVAGRRVRIDFGQFDAQLLLAIDGDTLLLAPLEENDSPASDLIVAGAPLRISCVGGQFELEHLRIWRDLYLLEPNGTDRDWQMAAPLAENEYLVLGDNPPVSIDSRHWQSPGLGRAKLRGVVIVPRPAKSR